MKAYLQSVATDFECATPVHHPATPKVYRPAHAGRTNPNKQPLYKSPPFTFYPFNYPGMITAYDGKTEPVHCFQSRGPVRSIKYSEATDALVTLETLTEKDVLEVDYIFARNEEGEEDDWSQDILQTYSNSRTCSLSIIGSAAIFGSQCLFFFSEPYVFVCVCVCVCVCVALPLPQMNAFYSLII